MRNWKQIFILLVMGGALYYLYPSLQFYGMSDSEK